MKYMRIASSPSDPGVNNKEPRIGQMPKSAFLRYREWPNNLGHGAKFFSIAIFVEDSWLYLEEHHGKDMGK